MDTADFIDQPTSVYEPYDVEVEVVEVFAGEKTTRVIEFDGSALGGEEKVVIGYLTMEEQGWFESMDVAEQQRALEELRRG